MDQKGILPHEHHDTDVQSHILEAMPDEEMICFVSDALGQLGDPSRLRIFWLLCHAEECVLDIAAAVDMTSPAVSHHLRILKTAGLIVSRRVGKEKLYKAADSPIVDALHRSMEEIMSVGRRSLAATTGAIEGRNQAI